ncbi:hypothetical protein ACRALDRAFT_2045012 [Sodiomyces alcalophilus JCM 7366]|uniref:uncharacterized protein n=1 Tax=Sodiomyces alcalophilus JCM 7366 TaxID=591952 RepID=UPI0039B5420E
MSDTPRQRTGGFPPTPASLPLAPESAPRRSPSEPVIPLTLLDGPQQRFYAAATYALLWAYRLYDFSAVTQDNESSVWFFLKWVMLDFAFLFGLPELRIPWLELSQSTVLTLWAIHSFINWMLMFNVGFPLQPWIFGLAKVFYDREISVSEQSVKVSSILHNHSLIMGKQIINILPEGSAVLNFEQTPFCLGPDGRDVAKLPIQFNSTIPAEIELVRVDLETDEEEVVKLSKKEINKIVRSIKELMTDSSPVVHTVDLPVKKTGIYRLNKVLDEYKLEVQRTTKDTYVVPCPQAKFRTLDVSGRCIRDLSDLLVDVVGTPPLKIVYSRTVNGKDRSFHFQSLQPDDYSSPLLGTPSAPLVLAEEKDISWVKPRAVEVRLNETLGVSGQWQYAVDEVQDGFGNVQRYAEPGEDIDFHPRPKHLVRNFEVKERPQARLRGCDLRNPLKVAKGKATELPVSFTLPGRAPEDTSHTIEWEFSPIDTLTNSGEHGDHVSVGSYTAMNSHDKPSVSAPGLYTLKSISARSCGGEIQEPSSCLLLNPLEPSLSIRAEEIPDKCAGNSVGLRLDLDLTGTPPFQVQYDIVHRDRVRTESVYVDGLRHQLDLLPKEAGHHKYIFKQIGDAIYKNQPLAGSDMVLEQDVKPAASAIIEHPSGVMNACLEEQVEVDILLLGDPPFSLEWEMVHDGKRKSEKVTGIDASKYTIKTAPFAKGGDHILALSSIQDKTGCRIYLNDELRISVRRQRPRAAFGMIENKKKVMAVQDAKVDLPLRLQGEAPWTISYRNVDGSGGLLQKVARSGNDAITVSSKGVYEIVDVSDSQCPGTIDPQSSTFEVDWFPRPEISIVPSEGISTAPSGFAKRDVCEGDIDGFEVNLQGSAPYHVEYEVRHKPLQGSGSMTRKEFDAALNRAAIAMDTSRAGEYTYQFFALADNLYNSDRSFRPLQVQQRVNARPSAAFVKPGQSFKYCKLEQENEDRIPITLTGVAPFYIELEVKHQGATVPETYRIPSINSNSYGIQIPRQHLQLGVQHVRIREVRDAKGCQQRYDMHAPSVQVHLYDAPAIYPLDSREDVCVGERIAYTLSGTPPFEVWYDFQGQQRKAKSQTTNFRRIAESPGDFTITSVSDKASECRAPVNLTKVIHPLPAVKMSQGRVIRVDIHEGNEVEMHFEFWGTPPFEFTYTRSTNAKKGQRSVVLETRHDISYEHSKIVPTSQEGTYEVVAIKDRFCSFSTQQVAERKDQKLRRG